MVFGWGKKKEEKKAESISALQEIGVSDIPDVIKNLKTLREKQLISEISTFRKKTNPLIKELSQIIKELEKDDLKVDEFDKRLRIIVARGKKQVIEIVKKDSVELEPISNIDDALKVTAHLGQMLKKIGDVLGRQTRIIHIFAKKYAEKLKQILEEMNQNHNEMQGLINNFEKTKQYFDLISLNYDGVRESEKSHLHNQRKKEETAASLNSINSKIESLNNSLNEIKQSSQYKKYMELKEKLSKLESDQNQIKNEIDSQFTKISRPLGRYEYVSSLEKEQKNLLTQLIKEPADAVTSSNKDSIIVILENIRKGITSGTISVKDEEKSLQSITETEELLDNFISSLKDHKNRVQELKAKISSTRPQKLGETESILDKFKSDKEDLESKMRLFEDEIDSATKKIPSLIRQIESDLQKFSNTKYTVTFQEN